MPIHWSLRISSSVCAAGLLCGCPNPNTYTVPRTLNPGTVQWQVAPEFIGTSFDYRTTDANGVTRKANFSGVLPMVPSFGARIGIVDGFDLGAHLMNFDSLEVDGKIRLVKGGFDVALQPGLQGYYVSVNNASLGVVYLHVPVLLGINLSPRVSLVLSPGFVYAIVAGAANNSGGISGASTVSGAMARLGAGVDFRISKKFAIHPELTFMKGFGDDNLLLYVGGVGFNFGAMPDYSDL